MLAGRRKSAIVTGVSHRKSAARSNSMGALISHVSEKVLGDASDSESANGMNGVEPAEIPNNDVAVIEADEPEEMETVEIDFVTLGMFIIGESNPT
jgi:hypothetical protein